MEMKTNPYKKDGWYMTGTYSNRYERNATEPPEFLTDEQIYLETEAIIGHIDLGDTEDKEQLEKLSRQVRDMPILVHVEAMIEHEGPDKIDQKADMFFKHHFHPGTDTLRVITGGTGYFDVMDLNGRWIRRPLERGDFYIIPPGCYHRVSLDTNKSMKCIMLHYEAGALQKISPPEGDKHPTRIHYLERLKSLRRALDFDYKTKPSSLDVYDASNHGLWDKYITPTINTVLSKMV